MRKEPANQEDIYTEEEKTILSECTLCPRECKVDRLKGAAGYCGMDAGLNISSICLHKGEEPPVSGTEGICNIFFAGCNLHCIYCQNHEISRPDTDINDLRIGMNELLDRIENILSGGINAVGFVSPSHMVFQLKSIIRGLHKRGLKPIIVYNTNSYDKIETLRELAEYIDVYLPDIKYVNAKISELYSDAYDYPEVAMKALKEMYYQKGSSLIINENGLAERGILVRHLVLPGQVEESKKVLETIAAEISTGVHISLMSQYHPTLLVAGHNCLGRTLHKTEYDAVVRKMENLGFRNGWIQDMDSFNSYRPDFRRENPFE
jgi:putative pyruvate formate lyase activating enzyme